MRLGLERLSKPGRCRRVDSLPLARLDRRDGRPPDVGDLGQLDLGKPAASAMFL